MKITQKDALIELLPKYLAYLKGQIEIDGYSKTDLKKRVELLNEYYSAYDTIVGNTISATAKYRLTILEEFVYLLFRKLIADIEDRTGLGKTTIRSGVSGAYVNMFFTGSDIKAFFTNIDVKVNTKDQDYAIYRELLMSVDGASYPLNIPVAAVECKTYVEKTMLERIIATAEKVKSGNPYCRFVVVTETWAVGAKVDPAYSRVDQIYVLRKCNRGGKAPIAEDVVIRLFEDTRRHLENTWSNPHEKLKNTGLII